MSAEVTTANPPQYWLMRLWLFCFLAVIAFALFSYIAGRWYPIME